MSNETSPSLYDLPPSCKLVYKTLEEADDLPVSLAELRAETWLADTTLRDALERLEEAELVLATHQPGDARGRRYDLD